jgi:inner membrane protein
LDNLTHGLVGAAIAKAGAGRATPLATPTLVIAANAPDIDVFGYLGGEYFALSFRRGITHGWPALIVLPFLVTATMLAWDRWVRRRRHPGGPPARPGPLLALSGLGVATHPALDWTNTYGMRWGLPFDPSWTYGDALFIIDPWIWLALGGSLFIASRPRLGLIGWALLAAAVSLPLLLFPLARVTKVLWLCGLSSVVVTRLAVQRGRARRLSVLVGLAAVLLYIGAMVGSDLLARDQVAEAARAGGLEVRDLMVAPLPADPFGAEIEVLTDEGYVPGDLRWTRTPRVRLFPERIVPFLHAPPGMAAHNVRAVVDAARADPEAARYLVWSRYPYAKVAPNGDGWTVAFADARYDSGPGAGSLGGPTVTILPDDRR